MCESFCAFLVHFQMFLVQLVPETMALSNSFKPATQILSHLVNKLGCICNFAIAILDKEWKTHEWTDASKGSWICVTGAVAGHQPSENSARSLSNLSTLQLDWRLDRNLFVHYYSSKKYNNVALVLELYFPGMLASRICSWRIWVMLAAS